MPRLNTEVNLVTWTRNRKQTEPQEAAHHPTSTVPNPMSRPSLMVDLPTLYFKSVVAYLALPMRRFQVPSTVVCLAQE